MKSTIKEHKKRTNERMRALHPPSSSSSSSPKPWNPSADLLLSPADAPPFRYSPLCFHHDYSYHQNYRRHYCCYIFKKVQIDLPAGQGRWGNNGSKKSNKSTRPEREKRRFLSSLKCVAPVHTHPHTHSNRYIFSDADQPPPAHKRHGAAQSFITKEKKGAHNIKCMCTSLHWKIGKLVFPSWVRL